MNTWRQPISATENAPGLITITYDTNIKIGGHRGFTVRIEKILIFVTTYFEIVE
jgi:hypothetical protein